MAKNKTAGGLSDKTSDIILVLITAIVLIIVAYPLYYVLIASFSNPYDVYAGKTFLLPSQFSFRGYQAVFADKSIYTGYLNSIKYTVIGTIFSVVLLYITAYPLAQKDLPGRKWISLFFIITMYFGGGLVPTYLIVKKTGLIDNMWALFLPGGVGVGNMIIVRNYFQNSIPHDLIEAAEIDGLNPIGIFIRVVFPLSMPIIATMILFNAVGYWNNWYNAFLYLDKKEMWPVAYYLRTIITGASTSADPGEVSAEKMQIAANIKSCSMVLMALPIICVYPFVQKYYVQGMMLGGVKE